MNDNGECYGESARELRNESCFLQKRGQSRSAATLSLRIAAPVFRVSRCTRNSKSRSVSGTWALSHALGHSVALVKACVVTGHAQDSS